MAGPTAPNSNADAPQKVPGLTALIARVLEQLAVSAWLPAAMLMGVGSMLVQLRNQDSLDVAVAVGVLADPKSWGIVIILLFGIVLTTMVTQAFSFSIIRGLEGYWPSGPLSGLPMRLGVHFRAWRYRRLRKRVADLDRALHKSAVPRLAKEKPEFKQVWEQQLYTPKNEWPQKDRAVIRAANAIDWRKKGGPSLAALFARAHDRVADYPTEPTRVLPTLLGNVLRAHEDQLRLKGHALERYVMEHYAAIPARLLRQHDQFRDRLDMYALLTLVFTAVAGASVPLLWGLPTQTRWLPAPAISALTLMVLAWMSYRAAIASARGYGATLLAINRTVAGAANTTSMSNPAAPEDANQQPGP